MHQTKKGNQWNQRCADGFAYRRKAHNRCAQAKGYGIDVESDLIHSVQTTAANVHDLTPAAELLLGEQTVVCADAGYQGIANRPEMADKEIKFSRCHGARQSSRAAGDTERQTARSD
jgi:IS5 family transposase